MLHQPTHLCSATFSKEVVSEVPCYASRGHLVYFSWQCSRSSCWLSSLAEAGSGPWHSPPRYVVSLAVLLHWVGMDKVSWSVHSHPWRREQGCLKEVWWGKGGRRQPRRGSLPFPLFFHKDQHTIPNSGPFLQCCCHRELSGHLWRMSRRKTLHLRYKICQSNSFL